MGRGGIACPKPEPRKRTAARRSRLALKNTHMVRMFVFARERNICRCCRARPADSMHEMRPRSLGGKVSRQNSIAVCGSGTTGCHGLLQAHRIDIRTDIANGAMGPLSFTPTDRMTSDWMKIPFGDCIISEPMSQIEADE